MHRIGLTGGIAAGKSTVSQWFRTQGVKVIDADVIAREVVTPGSKGLKRLVSTFGNEILLADKSLDRPKLGELVFGNEENRNKLNDILHDEIWQRMSWLAEEYEKAGEHVIIYDVPLLIETGWHKRMDEVWLVYVAPDVQLSRLCLRDECSEEMALKRINSQMLMDEKKSYSDEVIYNNQTREELVTELQNLWNKKKASWGLSMEN